MRRSLRLVVLPLFLLGLAAGFHLLDALRTGEDALIARRYADAATALQKALEEEPAERHPRILLLLARAQTLAGTPDRAVQTYERLVRDHADSRLAAKAAMARAETLASSGRFAEAADAYRAQVDWLTGGDRKQEVAETYLGLADKARAADDWARAVMFYDLAVDLGLGDTQARMVRLLSAEALLAAGNPGAVQRFEPLVAELTAKDGKRRAMLGLGRARSLSGDRVGARSVLRDLLAEAPDSGEAGDAAFELARTFGVPEPGADLLDRAIAALRSFAASYPAHPKAEVAEYLVARCYLSVGRSEEGLASLRGFLSASGGRDLEEVASARAQVGFVLSSQERIDDAIDAWRAYLAAHPSHQMWEQVQRAIVDAELQRAIRAESDEEWERARELFAQFERDHPLHGMNADLLRRTGETFARQERFDEALQVFARCVQKFPGRNESSHAQFRIGEIHENQSFDYQRALDAYRAVTWGNWQSKAQARIQRLERKALALRTERTFRAGEAARFELTSRNIAEVRVRVYRLDFETWFRATHRLSGVDGLDIEVIAADRTFESPVPDYLPFRETRRQVEIGFTEPGAYVVKVDDQELEATTMVLVTDIGLIVKSSREELFVFAQDLGDETPRSGVRILVSDGQKVLHEGVTGSDGVLRYRDAALARTDAVSVLGVDASGSGAGQIDLGGLSVAEGLTPKAYLFTDRPAYRPGEAVHAKGIVRDVRAGRYELPPVEEGATARLLSPSGRVLVSRDVRFTAFGTFALDAVLPENAEIGVWRVELTRGDVARRRSSTITFTVAEYELPRVQLTVEPDQKVVFRGEPIAGKVRVRHFYGEAAVGRALELTLRRPDGAEQPVRAVSDADGTVSYSFDTTEFPEEAIAILEVRDVVGGASVASAVPVVTTELQPRLSVLRETQLSARPFEVTIGLVDRSGAALSRAGELVLLRRDTVRGSVAETEVMRVPFRTEGDEGEARVRVRAEKGGQHVLRVQIEDRTGQVVTKDLVVDVVGEEDQRKLHILAERQTYEVGERLVVTIVNRGAGEHLALRTFQADGVFAHETFRLPEGESRYEVELTGDHAPNFGLGLAMIAGTSLHTAEQDFVVSRDLDVTLRPSATLAEPGAEIDVVVEARDAAGRPVEGEFALALVDRALYERYADPNASIGAFFWGGRRQTTLRTTSTASWSYAGPSRPMSDALVAEERQLELLERAAADAVRESGSESAFDSNQWNSAVGLGGGAGGRIPTPGGGGGGGGFFAGRPGGPATPGPAGPASAGPGGPVTGGDRSVLGRQQAMAQSKADQFFLGAGLLAPDPRSVTTAFFADPDDSRLRYALELPTDEARALFAPDGAWISSVRTDAEGTATVQLRLPPTDGGFRLTARGVTRATDVGDARVEVRTARDLVASIQAPRVLVAGDRTTIRTSLHNRTSEPMEVSIVRRVGAEEVRGRESLGAGEERVRELEHFAAAAGAPTAVVEAGAARASIDLDVMPFGVERRVGKAGVVRDVAQFGLALPADQAFSNLALELDLGVGGARGLVDAALASGVPTDNCTIGPNTLFDLTQRGLAASAVLDHLDRVGADARGERSELEGRLSGVVAALVAAQDAAGGLPWGIGRKGAGPGAASPELRTTTASLRLFHAAAARGVAGAEPAAEAAARYLLDRLRGLPDEQRTEPEHALAVTGRGRFENLFALHRRRAGLDLGSLGRLALAWRAIDRPALADEVDATMAPQLAKLGRVDARHVADVAIAVQSLLQAGPADPRIPPVLEWIESRRVGRAWATAEATAEAVRALCIAGGDDRSAVSDGQLVVLVNGRELAALPLDRELQPVPVPSDLLGAAENRIELRVRGRGQVRYSAVLSGFSAGFDDSQRNFGLIRTGRSYRQPYLRLDGKVVQPGTSIVQEVMQTGENRLTQLVVGEPGRVDTHFMFASDNDALGVGPLVVEEPIPAGCTVPESSIQGSFASYEVLPGRLRFYYAPGARGDLIRYELVGRFPGKYRALPTVVYGSGRPDMVAYGPVSSLEVLPAGGVSADAYQMSPDERWAFGRAAYAKGELVRAGELLAPLASGLVLRSSTARELAEMMLIVAIDAGEARAVVRWFEELKDRAPDFVVPFDAIRAVGSAYSELGEHELAVLVYRATAESSFLKEAQVARTLQELGEVQSSVRFLRRLLSTYPDLNSVRQSLYGIGQRLALLAASQNPGARVDPRVGDRLELRRAAVDTFREFLIQYPEDPLAEEVSFAWATTLIEGGQLERALEVAEGALARYPESSLEDEFLYTVGYARFVGGKAEEALDVVRRVATENFVGSGGQMAPSQNRPHAIYLEGQILHSEGEVEDALRAYDEVAKDFTDAAEAAAYFRRRELSLPEVTRIDPAAASKIVVTSRNVESVTVQAYRVDLMRLYLLRKSLDDVRGIQLHGIAPVFDTELGVEGAADHAERRLDVALPFEGEGAYLVVARSGELLATGLVLRSGLTIDAEENLGAGRVRVNVRRPGGFVGAAEVKVVGSADGRIRGGETDLRGIFVADDVVGRATVLVRVGDAFAFFRGEGIHQPGRMPSPPSPQRSQQIQRDAGPAQKGATRAFNAWENNLNLNVDNRARQSDWLEQQVLMNPQRGVQVQRAK